MGDGVHDDTAALQTLFDKRISVRVPLPKRYYRITRTIHLKNNSKCLIRGCVFEPDGKQDPEAYKLKR